MTILETPNSRFKASESASKPVDTDDVKTLASEIIDNPLLEDSVFPSKQQHG